MWDLNSGHGTVNMRPCSTMFGMYVNEDKIKNLRTFLCAVITTRDSGTKVKMQILNMAYFNCFIYTFFFFFSHSWCFRFQWWWHISLHNAIIFSLHNKEELTPFKNDRVIICNLERLRLLSNTWLVHSPSSRDFGQGYSIPSGVRIEVQDQ